ncbi:ABC transporter ATP-binding protein [Stackebrandtia nassauensis]|uniref:ABC transporter related protein n=1 Tax=Stackebrandtia nassauensis (strain DSM 44728 / CIP 108903 / NRRL B-16338 / NBRC 102104 / LLR-40K-21) TaxID=446470 RepID=D3PXX1_STANL|nr:ABC transporter ATP-binding protein [Stackebrandtia nassauensis]ADD45300.1 ABC transporter related protein [Stackebrandtia nassauensis DSM 44728]
MTEDAIIEAHDLGVRFAKGRRRNARLREVFTRRNRSTTAAPAPEFWPLRHLSFEIQPGEAVGVIGSNGTGKSTLLRLLAGVLIPDEGQVIRRGRVAPLIALSAGFSGDLTGRENVQLVASLHGMDRKTLKSKFDEIVAFAEVEDHIDTPVRHYSSGMKVRLGFSVISQLEHPILLVDEALAVGDKRFKKKCYKTMRNLLNEGRTLILVSHSERDLTKFCTRGMFLNAGELEVDGTVDDALAAYQLSEDQKVPA